MAREKEFFRETVADIVENTGKRILGVNDIKKYLKIGHSKAVKYLDGNKTITAYQFAQKLI
jgi:hypothetical protein